MRIGIIFLFFFSCNEYEDITHCVKEEELVERWFEIDPKISDHCYLLAPDGGVIEKDLDRAWGIGYWSIVNSGENCLFEILLEDEPLQILGKDSGCILVEYKSQNAMLCDCPY